MPNGNEPHNPYEAPSVSVDPPPTNLATGTPSWSTAFQSTRGVANVTKVFLYVNAVVAAMSMMACIWAAYSSSSMLSIAGIGTVSSALVAYSLLAVVELLARLACAIPFCIWIYRAYVNLLALGCDYTAFKPGWAPGSFFVPFLNLVRPHQIVKEIWMNSKNDEAATNWGAVNRWWALWLSGNIVSYIGSRLTGTLGPTSTGLWLGAAGDAFLCAAAIAAAIMVGKIERRQSEMAETVAQRRVAAAAANPAGIGAWR